MKKLYRTLSSIISVTMLILFSSWHRYFPFFRNMPINSWLKPTNLDDNYLKEKVNSDSDNNKYRAALDASLYANLQKLMDQEKIYRNPNLSRDIVVANLGTSKKVFLEVLQRNINMNFIDYINTYRMSDALDLLQNSEYTNETIAAEAGFGSVNTFYRQFRLRYGCSPAEYKKSVLFKSVDNESSCIEKM